VPLRTCAEVLELSTRTQALSIGLNPSGGSTCSSNYDFDLVVYRHSQNI
jgi:hypothetical protein